jgi:O-antigen/teichoic acid export membrane protein
MMVYGGADALVGLVRIGLSALYTRVLAPADFGLLAVLYVTVSLAITLLPLGLPSAMMIRFRAGEPAEARQHKDTVYAALLRVCLLLLAAGGVAAALGLAQPLDRVTVIAALLWAVASILSTVPSSSLRFAEKVVRFSTARVSQVVVQVAVLWYLWATSHVGLREIVVAETAGSLASLLLAHVLDRYVPRLRLSRPRVIDLLTLGAPLCFLGVGHFVIDLSDRYIVTLLLGAEATGYYAVAARLAIAGSLVAEALNSMWLPYFYRLAGSAQVASAALRRAARRLVYALGVVMALAMLVLPYVMVLRVAGRWFIAPAYHATMALVAPLLLQYFFKAVYYLATPAVNFHERTWRQVAIIYGAGLLNCLGNVAVILLLPGIGVYALLTLVALMTSLSYAAAMALLMRELDKLYAGGGPGGAFLALVSLVVLLPLAPVGLGVRIGLVVVWAGVVGWGYRRDLLGR